MKVLHFTHTYQESNGVANYVENLVKNTPPAYSCQVISSKGHSLPFFSSLKIPVGEFWTALNSDFDVIHIHAYGNFFSFFGALVSIIKRKPMVWSIYGYTYITGWRKGMYYVYRYLMAPLIFWRAGAIAAVSHDAISKLRAETKKEILFIPSGVDLDFFKPSGSYREQKNVCFVGRLDDDKQPERLLECKDRPLLFMGRDEDGKKERLKAAAESQKLDAKFIEVSREEVPGIYSSCRYVVLPSKYEGFPLTMLESLAMERPFIATDVGEVKSTLAGLFREPDEFILGNDLGKTIESLEKKNLEPEMKAARRKLEQYSWASIAKRTAELYEKVSAGQKR